MRRIYKHQSDNLYRLIKFLHDLFVHEKIKYWITGGTLLGAIRHNGLIPWDDDGDVCIYKKDENKLKKIAKEIEPFGYKLKLKEGGMWYLEHLNSKLGIDIFIMIQLKRITTFDDPIWKAEKSGGVNCYFLNKHLFPLKLIQFGNFYVYAPNHSILHLNTCYGDNWNSKIKYLYNHRSKKWENKKKLKLLKMKDFIPKSPPKDTLVKFNI